MAVNILRTMKHNELALSSENIDELYKEYDKRVIDFMRYIILDLEDEYKLIPISFRANFNLLANLLAVYYDAVDVLHTPTEYPAIHNKASSTIMNCTNQIVKICSSFGCDPLGKSKIKKLNSSDDETANYISDILA